MINGDRAHLVIIEELLFKEFHCMITDHMQVIADNSLFIEIKIVLQISDEILVLLIAALVFKGNPLWH